MATIPIPDKPDLPEPPVPPEPPIPPDPGRPLPGPEIPPTPESLAAYLHDLLKNYADEPEAIKAGVRYAILALRRMQRAYSEPR